MYNIHRNITSPYNADGKSYEKGKRKTKPASAFRIDKFNEVFD